MTSLNSGVLVANIHRPDAKLPIYSDHSKFFIHAQAIEKIEPQLTSFVKAKRISFNYLTPSLLKPYKGLQSSGQILELSLNLPDFPTGTAKPQLLIFDTPENNAMTIGRICLDEDQLHFQVARFHTGIPAQEDLSIAMQSAIQAPQLKEILATPQTLPQRMYITYLTREGHLTDWHRALYYSLGVSVPFTVVHAEHAQNPQIESFARVTKICPINLEGLQTEKLETLVMGDNTASGMQQIAVLEELLLKIKAKNNGDHKIKRLLIISPLLTLYGASIISRWAAMEENLSVTFIVSGAVLGCNPPDRYFSPVLAEKNFIANPNLIAINQAAYGPEAAGRACVRCNWTASFMAPEYAVARSIEELRMYGTTNEQVEALSKKLTLKEVKKLGLDPQQLFPYSTLEKAKRNGQLEKLKKLL